MEKPTVTASAIISFVKELENNSSKLYKRLSELFTENKDDFTFFAKESRENEALVTRTYQETITDALEACFSFEGLDLNDYTLEATLTEDASYPDVLKIVIRLEAEAVKFYLDVAERSKSLLATMPRAFREVAEKRNNRRLKLKSLLYNQDRLKRA